MSARRKRGSKRQPPHQKGASGFSPVIAPSQRGLPGPLTAQGALDECVGAICLVEVTQRSLESQEIATPEQEVLKRALNAIWSVHDWIDEPSGVGGSCEGADQEDHP